MVVNLISREKMNLKMIVESLFNTIEIQTNIINSIKF